VAGRSVFTPAFKHHISDNPAERCPEWRGSARMKDDGEAIGMMMQIGALLRLNMRDLANEPMRLQVMHQIRTQTDRDRLAALSLVPYEPLPEELQRLVERLRIKDRKGVKERTTSLLP
jgi:hypothetical protein